MLVGLAAVALVPSVLRPGELLVFRDLLDFFYPLKVHFARCLGEGAIPFWNPWTLGGEPFFANLIAQVLYPPNWLFAMVPGTAWALSLFTALHLAWAGWGTLALSRRLGVGRPAALVASAGFMAGGYLQSLVDLSNQLCTEAWLPWTCLAAVAWAATGSRRALAAWAATAAMSLLGGAPQVAVVGGALSVVLAAAGGWTEAPSPARLRRALGGGLAVAVLVAASCAPVLGPFAGMVGRSDRVGTEPYAAGGAGGLDPGRLDALVRPPTGPFSGPSGSYVRSIYLGATPLLLALVGSLRRRRTSRALLAATFVSVVLAASPSLPLLGPAVAAAAPWLRYPFKYFAAAALTLPLLAAGGLELALERGAGRRRRLAPVLAAVLAVAVLGDLVHHHRTLHLAMPAAGLLTATPAIEWLAAHTAPDGPRLHTLPLTQERFDRRAGRIVGGDLAGAVRERVELLEGGLPAVFKIAATTGGSALPDRLQSGRLELADGPMPPEVQVELRAGFLLVEADRELPLLPIPLDGGAARLYRLPVLELLPHRTWHGPNRCIGPPGLPAPSDDPGWREDPPGAWTYRPPGLVGWSLVGLVGWLAVAGLALKGRRPRRTDGEVPR